MTNTTTMGRYRDCDKDSNNSRSKKSRKNRREEEEEDDDDGSEEGKWTCVLTRLTVENAKTNTICVQIGSNST